MPLVVLLRGVNVGGHRTFRPSELAKQLAHLDIVNIGAAGTFVVRAPVAQTKLRAELQRALPFVTDIVICPGAEISGLLSNHPFEALPAEKEIVRFVTVLGKRPRTDPAMPADFPAGGRWLVRILDRRDRFVFGAYRRDMKTIRYLGAADRLFDPPGTTRNWNTITAIAKVLGAG
ncbi:MAG: DUF1697 domain-containing protein [Gemmatimonadales bacterium]